MPLIPYPNIPALPGVPALARSNNAKFVGAALNIVGQLLPADLFGPKWAILSSTGSPFIQPDSFVAFEYREERKIPTYPMEKGGFQSYNKVAMPFDIRVTVTCSGNGKTKKANFLTKLQEGMDSTELLKINTPEREYDNCNLIHVDYRKESMHGATLIIAQLYFQQIRIAQAPKASTTDPSGASKTPLGQLSPVTPSGSFGAFNPNSTGGIGIK
jgi:hypothetical protein